MRVIRNGNGWDIAFDIVFSDKLTAEVIAKRIQPALAALIRGAVDQDMCEQSANKIASGRTAPTSSEAIARIYLKVPMTQQGRLNLLPSSAESIVSRAHALGLLPPPCGE